QPAVEGDRTRQAALQERLVVRRAVDALDRDRQDWRLDRRTGIPIAEILRLARDRLGVAVLLPEDLVGDETVRLCAVQQRDQLLARPDPVDVRQRDRVETGVPEPLEGIRTRR